MEANSNENTGAESENAPKRTGKHLFQKGHPGGPGRPKTQKVNYRRVLERCVTESAMTEIVLKAVEQAKNGDSKARSWLIGHLIAPIPRTVKVENVEDQTTDSRRLLDSLINAVDNVTLMRVLEASRPQGRIPKIVDVPPNPQ